MRSIFDKIFWGIILLFSGPTAMIIASWNTLPGDSLYGTKLALERTALAIASPSYATAGDLQIRYTERRFAEAKQLLSSKQSVAGLPYLQQQIAQTKKAIKRAPNKTTQIALAKQYINALNTVSGDLEVQKQAVTSNVKPLAYVPPLQQNQVGQTTPAVRSLQGDIPTAPSTGGATPIQIAQVTTTAPITTQQAVIALQIDQTQQNVSQAISDLQTLVDEDDHSRDDRRGRGDDRGRSENSGQKKDDGGDHNRSESR